MQVKTKALVISTVKYQDKSLIIKCFTSTDGLKSYFIHNAYSKSSKLKIAFFQQGQLLDIEAIHKNKESLERLIEVKVAYAYRNIFENIHKSSQLFFLLDVLKICLKEDGENESLFQFLETSFIWLDTHKYYPEFHLVFLIQLSKFLGFMPSKKNGNELFFEKIEGVFQHNFSSSCLNKEDSEVFNQLICSTYDDFQSFSKTQREFLLNTLLEYYQWHVEGFRKPKSLEVLQAVFM
jgi:DNA repair protein RecO (recombination protein O)